ncbi:hypothetical protein [Flavobacterium limi]|uniref:Pentapeptide repeat-containing protein n=1 Tax=Flavobacterium limi TaxID=2045105 RepID=A0ABQ1V0C5_9FLAO|nr:hypothetical protein [Flavobacterium limi]GGF30021.1 hypothetical protein GCM10011518_44060 [Flavobacterium limi]
MKNRILSNNQIKHIIKRFHISIDQFEVDKSGRVNMFGNVKICNTKLRRLPLRFGKVDGDFHCYLNQLTTLKGSPYKVGGDFNCSGNLLKTLKHAPQEVCGDFFCQENTLEKLDGSPKIINGNFNCFLNSLKNLKNGPIEVKKSYYAYANLLTTLHGAPKIVGKSFHVGDNSLRNLLGCPSFIGEILSIDSSICSINLGNNNCIVKKVEIQEQFIYNHNDMILPKVIINNKALLPIIFKYYSYLELYNENNELSYTNFKNIIREIEEGLR